MNTPTPSRRTRGLALARRLVFAVPGARVIFLAVRNYVLHQSGNQAGSVAFSTVLSMFPGVLLLSSIAAYIGQPGAAATLVKRILGYAPQAVRNALQPVVQDVISQRNEALLSIGLLVTLWTASSGMQAVRTALNRAYGVERGTSFWRARLKVTLFTIVVGAVTIVAFSTVVVVPYVTQVIDANTNSPRDAWWLHQGVRYGTAYVVLVAVYALLYAWLTDIHQRLRTVLPGAVFGASLWLGAATLLSTTLRGVSQLSLIYGSFAGVVATLVFLYVSAATLILGAELNGVLRKDLEARDEREVKPDAAA